MKHWLSMRGGSTDDLRALADLAAALKAGGAGDRAAVLRNRLLIMLFFNPSLRTRVSFEAAMGRFGGRALALSVGQDVWGLEWRDGVIMNGPAAEHLREAAPVLGSYGDFLGVRAFAGMKDVREDARDALLHGFAELAGVPVISLESAMEHPCQGLADMLTMRERLGDPRGKRFVLTWAPHVKPLPMAVPHSALLAAAALGMEVIIAHPPGYDLLPEFLDPARQWCREQGTTLRVMNEQAAACRGADVLYVKSWGASMLYGQEERQRESLREHQHWQVTPNLLGEKALLMHCLPVRRNIVISDDALNHPRCIVVPQAANRMWTQAAILTTLAERR